MDRDEVQKMIPKAQTKLKSQVALAVPTAAANVCETRQKDELEGGKELRRFSATKMETTDSFFVCGSAVVRRR